MYVFNARNFKCWKWSVNAHFPHFRCYVTVKEFLIYNVEKIKKKRLILHFFPAAASGIKKHTVRCVSSVSNDTRNTRISSPYKFTKTETGSSVELI